MNLNGNAETATVTGTGNFSNNAGGSLALNEVGDVVNVPGTFTNAAGAALTFGSGSSGSSVSVTGVFNNAGGVVSMQGTNDTLTAAGGFTNTTSGTTAGTVTIGPDETLTTGAGDYIQSGGTTTVNGTLTSAGLDITGGSFAGTGTVNAPVTLSSGTLSSGGTIRGSLSNTGGDVIPFDPGNPATFTIKGNYTQGGGGLLTIDLGGTGTGQFSVLDVTGSATLAGTVDFTTVNRFAPAQGEDFTFMDYGSETGTLNIVETNWTCPTTCTDVFGPTSVTLQIGSSVSATPEPGTFVLAGTALIGMAGWLRRRGGRRSIKR